MRKGEGGEERDGGEDFFQVHVYAIIRVIYVDCMAIKATSLWALQLGPKSSSVPDSLRVCRLRDVFTASIQHLQLVQLLL